MRATAQSFVKFARTFGENSPGCVERRTPRSPGCCTARCSAHAAGVRIRNASTGPRSAAARARRSSPPRTEKSSITSDATSSPRRTRRLKCSPRSAAHRRCRARCGRTWRRCRHRFPRSCSRATRSSAANVPSSSSCARATRTHDTTISPRATEIMPRSETRVALCVRSERRYRRLAQLALSDHEGRAADGRFVHLPATWTHADRATTTTTGSSAGPSPAGAALEPRGTLVTILQHELLPDGRYVAECLAGPRVGITSAREEVPAEPRLTLALDQQQHRACPTAHRWSTVACPSSTWASRPPPTCHPRTAMRRQRRRRRRAAAPSCYGKSRR